MSRRGPRSGSAAPGRPGFDVARLRSRLAGAVRGEVSTDPGDRALYSTDASNYRVVPDLVVIPTDEADLVAAVGLAADAGAPVVVRGGGTSMAGNAVGGVVIDTSRHLNHILDLNPDAATATVEPGVVLTDLNAAAGAHGLTFGADPSSASRATLGGMIANNACGAHSVAWGTTADNVRALDVLLSDGARLHLDPAGPGTATDLAGQPGRAGELHRGMQELAERHALLIARRFGDLRRRISGYALDRLLPERGYDVTRFLSGTEGTLAVTLRATVDLVRPPAARALLVLGFADGVAAADSVPVLLQHQPLTVESINATLVDRLPDHLRREAGAAGLPPGQAWLLVEIGGEHPAAARAAARAVVADLAAAPVAASSAVVVDPRAQAVLWRCRRDATGLATRRADGAEAWGGWEDAAVPPARLGAYLRGLDELLAAYGLTGASYGHFGEGCMHMRMDFDLLTPGGLQRYRSFVEQATDLVVGLGGSVSGEHGDGRARSELLARMYGSDVVPLFEQVKSLWDPRGVLNPGVIADPVPLDRDVRHQGVAARREVHTVFAYAQDAGSFAQAQRRCVGVAKCRQSSGGVMCPSFQVTREERHSTRGRAHLLWEMLEGNPVRGGWRSTEVRDALDLCLSCKGCLSDCPVNVDMATYKAEFLHHHYAGRLRPRSHYSMGWLPVWARLAALAPGLVNAAARSPLRRPAVRLAGVAAQRELPRFATRPLRRWLADRPPPAAPGSAGTVLLWPDTFTSYLAPEVGRAAVDVLEDAGFRVVVPDRAVCCGLTWISTGQLGMARRVLRRSLRVLDPYLRAGIPVVGLEPSCLAVFRHDATALLPGEAAAARVRGQASTLAELLAERAPHWRPPPVDADALVQTHCHQHAVMGFEADLALMAAAGIRARVPDAGCCGLAGNFGFEREHYALSMAAGERVLLPAVRAADADTLVLADGFSCRTQISQGTGRRPRHLAEVLAGALHRRARTAAAESG